MGPRLGLGNPRDRNDEDVWVPENPGVCPSGAPSTFVSDSEPPDVLPPCIVAFLSDGCELTPTYVENCWKVMKGVVWSAPPRDLRHLHEGDHRKQINVPHCHFCFAYRLGEGLPAHRCHRCRCRKEGQAGIKTWEVLRLDGGNTVSI
jgi:hypothetical protein